MNKQQMNIIGVMLACALAFSGYVIFKDRGPVAGVEEAGHHEEKEGEHHDDGIVRFSEEQVARSGITVLTADARQIDSFIRMPGQIALNEDRTAHVTPRASGAVEKVEANLGQVVKKGDLLAVIASSDVAGQRAALATAEQRRTLAQSAYSTEKTLWEEKIGARQDYLKAEQELQEAEVAVQAARQSLQALGAGAGSAAGASNRLHVHSPFDGMVVEKHIVLGEVVGADTRVFTVSDLSRVWADVVVPSRDLEIVRVGTDAVIRSIASNTTAPGKVSFVSALIGEASRSAKARVVLDNPGLAWRPGLAVNVDIVTGSAQVPVAVAREALQTVEGRQVVYKRVAEGFVAQRVATGRSDERFVEIVSGLQPGERYAASGSFGVKAEQGKGEAGHHD
ncbi:efflux RND transporter periplasmic adaptor subunit [uncultured Massilia sp.]|uniref:efflux RND transporter periplasmic adaptor subunit n=1 Tax=uncultured Massilia sp. TaxID=169973 RepID=UPI002586D612|nr:efflux RND transporter periplasmic adaptor subunit [uncultured Massilia sp.]